jgi:molybdate transport system regulatory protein
MNVIPVIIEAITCSGGVVLVDMQADNCRLSAILIDGDELPPWLIKDASVSAVFKESELSLAVNLSGKISLRNRFPCTVQKMECGEIMSVVTLKFGQHIIRSAITTRSVNALELKNGLEVTALIKANELFLVQGLENWHP